MLTIVSLPSWKSAALGAAVALLVSVPPLKSVAAEGDAPPALQAADDHMVAVPRSSLGKEYLMSASVIPQFQAATSSGLAGKIVKFELYHDGLDLYESVEGLVVTGDLPARRLIATFPIVEQDDERIVIDFNRGMRRVFTSGWYSTSPFFNPAARERVNEVPEARVFEVNTTGVDLVVRQSVQVRDRQFDSNREALYEVRYYFSPYVPREYEVREMPEHETRYARFWEVQGTLEPETGRTSVKMARFDISEPVTFYYSANTPEEYEQAVIDGILYWNRAFGREVLKAEKAPEGVTAPDAAHNVVQWVPWDNAGFAYADVLIDPRSGESRHGQAYMTSVFAISGKARARALLRAMQEITKEGEKKDDKDGDDDDGGDKHFHFGLPFFNHGTACELDRVAFAEQYAAGLEELLASDEATDEAVLRAAQDYVREVVAHEVGHVIGLRHNFAGSLSATMSRKELDEFFGKYLADDDVEGYDDKLVSSSMMEYTVFKGGSFIGWWMRQNEANVLPHDKGAIRWGYFDDKSVVTNKILFATDQDAAVYGDVMTFDYGVDPVPAAYGEIADLISTLPNSVIESFIQARAPRDPRDRVPLEQVELSPLLYAGRVATFQNRILSWFNSSTRSLKVENEFELVGALDRKERVEAHWANLTNQLHEIGGVDRAVFSYLPLDLGLDLKKEPEGVTLAPKFDAKALAERLEKLLDTPAYAEFVGLDEQKYSFTEEEQKLIIERGRKLFGEIEKELLKRVCGTFERATRDLGLEATGRLGEDDVVADLEKRIIDTAKKIIMARDEKKRISGKVAKSFVEVVEFKHDYETRMAAAKMLNDNIGSFKSWSKDAKSDLNKQLKDEVEAALNINNMKDFKETMLSRPLRQWYLEQQALLNLLPAQK